MPDPTSGRLMLENDVIRFFESEQLAWELPLGSVRVFGEMTNQSGPFADDWFLCFASSREAWLEASAYAVGVEEFIKAISDRLDYPMHLALYGSADFASRILWPPRLAERPMFQFHPEHPGGLAGWFGLHREIQTFSPDVWEHLGQP